MRIAALSDIHGNFAALRAVLEEAKRQNVKKLLVLGDLVGYYYQPRKVFDLIEEWDYEMIRGNHELILAGMIDGTIDGKIVRTKYGSGHACAIRQLTQEQVVKLTNAPDTLITSIGNTTIMICHGSPQDREEYIYPDAARETFAKSDADADFVLIGHTHYPFVYRNKRSTLINVGSVGQSRVTGGIANWTTIDCDSKSFQMMATPYSTDILMEQINQLDPEIPYLKAVLKRNRG